MDYENEAEVDAQSRESVQNIIDYVNEKMADVLQWFRDQQLDMYQAICGA